MKNIRIWTFCLIIVLNTMASMVHTQEFIEIWPKGSKAILFLKNLPLNK